MLVAIFNDARADYVGSLENVIRTTPEFDRFRHRPRISNYQVGEAIVHRLEAITLVPSLLFVDPFGYKGLSLRLINSVLRHWGSDCIIFFNYNRINPGINNPFVKEHMDALFGAERAEQLRSKLRHVRPVHREQAILGEVAAAFEEMGGRFFLPFRFWKEAENRISHHLIFVSKNFRGYDIMKDVMAKESSSFDQGVPSFEHNPRKIADASLRFELSRPLDELEHQLRHEFAGRTLKMKEIYEEHSVGKPFLRTNYKAVLRNLYDRGAVEASPKPRKGSFADRISVTFPASSDAQS